MSKYNFLKGAIHIHTTASDGTGDIEKISKSAKKAGLNWIIITDHNKKEVKEGIYNGVYVLVGEEISPSVFSNHCMAFGLTEQIDRTDKPQEFFAEIKKQNAISCICHPHESLERKNSYRAIRWEYDDFSAVDGIEIWNYFSNWTNIYNDKNIFTQAYYYLFGNMLKNEPIKETLELWDMLNSAYKEVKFAIGGVDAHRIIYKKFGIPFPVYPYHTLFKTVINIIPAKEKLSENFEEARDFILSSIKSGNLYIVDRRREKNTDINFTAHNRDFAYSLGDIVPLDDDSGITVELPRKADIKLIKDGVLWLQEKNTKSAYFKIKYSGKYRVEICINSNAWAFLNPVIYVEKGEKQWTSENI